MSGIFKDWVSVTSWHGVADCYRAGSVVTKVIWFLILMATTLMFTSQVYVQYDAFQSNDKQPWLQTPWFETRGSIPLPVLTLCSMNQAEAHGALEQMNMSIQAASYVVRLLHKLNYDASVDCFAESESSFLFVEDPVFLQQKEAFLEYLSNNPKATELNFYEMLLAISPKCSKVIQMLFINYQQIDGEKLCMNATVFYYPFIGICYSFQPTDDDGVWINQTINGDPSTLVLRVNMPADHYAPLILPKAVDYGLMLFMGFDPVGSVTDSPSYVMVRPGMKTWVAMRYEEHRAPSLSSTNPFFALTLPQLPCVMQYEPTMLDAGPEMSVEGCVYDCMMETVFEQCGCNPTPFPVKNETAYPYCKVDQCEPILDDDAFYQICLDRCVKPVCASRAITARVSSTKSPINATNHRSNLKQIFGSNLDLDEVESIATVSLYYEQLTVKVSQYQLRTTVDQLISNIGGQLGLWAGISIITLYQALIYAFMALTEAIKSCYNKSNNRSVPKAKWQAKFHDKKVNADVVLATTSDPIKAQKNGIWQFDENGYLKFYRRNHIIED